MLKKLKTSIFNTRKFIEESIKELKKVSWPTKKETFYFTLTVLIVSILVALYLTFWDTIYQAILKFLIS